MSNRSLGHRAPLLWLVLPLIAGLAWGQNCSTSPIALVLVAGLSGAIALLAASNHPRIWGAALCVSMFLAGDAAYALNRMRVPAWDSLPPREARMVLEIDRVFPPSDPRRTTGLATVVETDAHLGELLRQRVYFSLALRPAESPPIRSSTIAAVGVLVALPRQPPTHTFDAYLAGAGMNFRLTRGRIVKETSPPDAYYRFCARAAQRFKTILGFGIAEKQPALTGLLRAMMLGETHELSDEQHTLFMQSGTMHLFAISGLNIAVIAGALQAILLLLRLPAWSRFIVGTALLWLFVDITGGAPSAVRAFIMAAFVKSALVLRRPANPLAALAASALVVLLLSPLQVFSASFLMSYGIVAALLVLGLPLSEAWQARWAPWRDVPMATWNWMQKRFADAWQASATAVAIGVAATLVSLLTGVQFFQLLTPGTLLANLALIPAAMAATVAGFASLLCGIVGFDAGAHLSNHAAAVVLYVIERLVWLSVQVPGAHIPATFVAPWIGMTAIGVLLASLFVGYATNWRTKYGSWWPPFVVVACVLLFGVRYG